MENPDHVNRKVVWIEVDGRRQHCHKVILKNDGRSHTVVIRLG